jgi:hypothetical protein
MAECPEVVNGAIANWLEGQVHFCT